MKWAYSLNCDNAGPILVEEAMTTGTIQPGAGLTYGTTTNGSTLTPVTVTTGADFVGIFNGDVATAFTTTMTTGTLDFGEVLIDPFGVYRTQYDMDEDNDIDVSSSTTTAITIGSADDDLDGSWVYVNSGTGEGQLVFIGAATTTVLTLDTTDPFATAPDSTSDIILIRRKWRFSANSGKDLATGAALAATDEDETGEFLTLEHWIQGGRGVALEPLRPRRHHAIANLHTVPGGVRFYADLYPLDHLLRGPTTHA